MISKLLTILLVFASSTQAVILHCYFGDIEFPFPVGLIYTCYNVQVTNPNNSPVLENILGIHVIGKTNADVTGLTVGRDETTTQFPKNVDLFFPNLLALEWYLGVLTSITANDLHFPSLQHLHLSRNNLPSLDGDLLKHTPRLFRIAFYSNSLQNVGFNLLDHLNELSVANFFTNPCINYRAETPQEMENLRAQLANQCPPFMTTTTTPTTTTTLTTTSSTTTTPVTSTTSATTTTEKACPIRCTIDEEVDQLKEKLAQQDELNMELKLFINAQSEVNLEMRQIIDEQSLLNKEQSQVNQEQSNDIKELNEMIAINVKRIVELEKQVRELMAIP